MKYTIEYWISKGIKVLNEMPKGWIKRENTMTQPRGYHWYFNDKSVFSNEYEHCLVKD